MGWLEGVLSALGINMSSVIFGFFGALLHALRSKANRLERWISFSVGFVLASFAPSAVIKWFSLAPDPAYYSGLGFVFGYFGMALVDAGTEAVTAFKQLDWKEAIGSWFRKG
jgi:hypothetical protein